MEQITRSEDGGYYYGDHYCRTADDAYERFRDAYNESMGRQFYKRLNRIGRRKERVHTFGFVFAKDSLPDDGEFAGYGKTKCRLLGFIGHISLARVVGCWEMPRFSDDEVFERWVDWAFSRGSGVLRLVDTQHKHGRTNRKIRKTFR